MKTRLPKTLLLAVLAAMATVAEGATLLRPHAIITTETDNEDITQELLNVEAGLYNPNRVDENGNALPPYDGNTNTAATVLHAPIVKDGGTSAIITSDEALTLYMPFIVREGKVTMQDVSVKSTNCFIHDHLSVGGTNAILELNNANYIQTWGYAGGATGYNKSASIGTPDGAGTLILDNNSSFHTMQVLHIGRKPYLSEVLGTYAETEGDTPYVDTPAVPTGSLYVKGGSVVGAGTVLQTCNAYIEVSGKNTAGEGSKLISGSRTIFDPVEFADANGSGMISRICNDANSETTIKVSEGGEVLFNNRLYTGYGDNSKVTISVTGEDSKFTSQHETIFGYKETTNGTSASLDVTDKASVHMTDATLAGAANAKVDVSIDKTSSYTGSKLTINAGGTFTNKGSVALADGSYVSAWIDNRPFGPDGPTSPGAKVKEAVYTEVDAALAINEGGKLVNSGSITVAGALTMSGGAELVFDLTVLDMDNLPSLTVERLSMTDGAAISLIFSDVDSLKAALGIQEAVAAVMALTDEPVVYSGTDNSTILNKLITFTSADGLAEAEDIELTLKYADESVAGGYATYSDSEVTLGAVANAVPEPTTATLSLLALAGLCARRRRR